MKGSPISQAVRKSKACHEKVQAWPGSHAHQLPASQWGEEGHACKCVIRSFGTFNTVKYVLDTKYALNTFGE